MEQVRSSVEIRPVHVEPRIGGGTAVWLHRNIRKVTEDGQDMWAADGTHGTVDGIVGEAWASARFAELWERFEAPDAPTSPLAAVDGETATANHAAGTLLVVGGGLYRVTSPIAAGERIEEGRNVSATTVADELAAIAAK